MDFSEIKALENRYFLQIFGRQDVCFTRGCGTTIWDSEGNAYTDLFGGIAVNALGYDHPAVTEAVCHAAKTVMHTSNLYYVEPQARLAQLLVENTCADRVFFANSGAEANEGAFKFARKFFYHQGIERYEIISANGSFHGRTMATVAATGQPKYQAPYRPLTPGFLNVAYGDLSAIEQALSPRTAAVLLETIQGEGGVQPAGAQYLKDVAALCKREGILLILDEVQTGMGRTGKLFSYEHFGIEPDLFTSAKALGGGVPIGAVLMKQFVADAIHPGDHGSTFGGNALACAAGVAVMETMLSENLPAQAAQKGEQLLRALKALSQPCIREVRGMGLLVGVELDPSVPVGALVAKCLKAGFVVGSAAHNTLRLAPPLIIDPADLTRFVTALDAELGSHHESIHRS